MPFRLFRSGDTLALRGIAPTDGTVLVKCLGGMVSFGVRAGPVDLAIASDLLDGRIVKARFVAKARLPQGEHDTPPKGKPRNRSAYAVPEHYVFPIDTPTHIRAALAYFHKHRFDSPAQKREAGRRIRAAARRHGIEVSGKDEASHAAD